MHCWPERPSLRAPWRAQVQHAAGEYAAALGCLLAAAPGAAFEYVGRHLAEPGCPAGLRTAVLAAIGRLADADGEAAARLVRCANNPKARLWLPLWRVTWLPCRPPQGAHRSCGTHDRPNVLFCP
jgi:hypothetical protein